MGLLNYKEISLPSLRFITFMDSSKVNYVLEKLTKS